VEICVIGDSKTQKKQLNTKKNQKPHFSGTLSLITAIIESDESAVQTMKVSAPGASSFGRAKHDPL